MSWGFFCDVMVTLPASELARASKSKTDERGMTSPIFGFRSAALEEAFTICHDDEDEQPNLRLAELPSWCEATGGRSSTTTRNGLTTFRGTMLLDRGGDPWIAKTAAALLHATRGVGEGYLLLVNDGSYSGEDGVLLRLEGDALTSTAVPDCRPHFERFGPALFERGELPTADEVFALCAGKRGAKKGAATSGVKGSTTKSSPKRS